MVLPKYYFFGEFNEFRDDLIKNNAMSIIFQPGEYILPPGDKMYLNYYIERGLAKYSILGNNGEEKIFMFLGPGTITPYAFGLYDFRLEFYITISALTPVHALALSPEGMRKIADANGEFAIRGVYRAAKIINLALSRNMFNTCSDPMEKVCTFLYLYDLCNPDGTNCINLSQEVIGRMIDLSREQISRIFSILRREGSISTSRGRCVIRNIDMIRERCIESCNDVDTGPISY